MELHDYELRSHYAKHLRVCFRVWNEKEKRSRRLNTEKTPSEAKKRVGIILLSIGCIFDGIMIQRH
jgi:hypothetical protein